jgi:hypothetical protein
MANRNTAAQGKAAFSQHMILYLRRQKRKVGVLIDADAAIKFCQDWELRQHKKKKAVAKPPKTHPADSRG